MIYIVCPQYDADLTQAIGLKIAEASKVHYLGSNRISPKDKILVLELRGYWDREDIELYIDDKTKTQAFLKTLGMYFEVGTPPLKSPLSKKFTSNFCSIGLSNRIRYNEEARKLFIKICEELLKEIKAALKIR